MKRITKIIAIILTVLSINCTSVFAIETSVSRYEIKQKLLEVGVNENKSVKDVVRFLKAHGYHKQVFVVPPLYGEDGQIKYEVEGFDSTGKYELKYNYNTNQIGETKEGAYKVSLEKKAFDPTRILTPDAVVNFAFAQTKGQATSLNRWSVKNEKGRFVYDVEFGAANHQEIEVHVDAFTGELVSVKGVK